MTASLIEQTGEIYEAMPKDITTSRLDSAVWHTSNGMFECEDIERASDRSHEVAQLIQSGLNYYSQSRLDEAAECYKRALALRPDNLVALYDLGIVYGQLARYQDSKNLFEKLVRLLESSKFVQLFERSGQAADQASLLAVGHQGIGAGLLGIWGSSHSQTESNELANKIELEFQQAVTLDPNCFGAWMGLGVTLQHIKEHLIDAEAAFRKATAIDPESAVAKEHLRNVKRALMQRAKGIWKDRNDLPNVTELRREWNRF